LCEAICKDDRPDALQRGPPKQPARGGRYEGGVLRVDTRAGFGAGASSGCSSGGTQLSSGGTWLGSGAYQPTLLLRRRRLRLRLRRRRLRQLPMLRPPLPLLVPPLLFRPSHRLV